MAKRARPPKIGPLTRKLTGILRLPRGKDYKQLLTEALLARHKVKNDHPEARQGRS